MPPLGYALISGWRSGSLSLQPLLSDRGTAADRIGARLRTVLVSAEVALAVLVLIDAALLVSSRAGATPPAGCWLEVCSALRLRIQRVTD